MALAKEEEKDYREVKLQYTSCCGCGCDEITLLRKVPIDSLLKDGDMAEDYEDGDIVI